MDKFIIALAGIVVGAAAIVGLFALKPATPPAGAASGPDVYARTFFHDNIGIGGGTLASSSIGAATYTAAQIVNNRLIEQTATGALTATLPTAAALSAAGFLPNVGDTQSVFIYATTTNVTIAAGAGINLVAASSTIIDKGTMAEIKFLRLGTGATDGRAIQASIVGN